MVEADIWLHRGRLELRHSKTLRLLPLRCDEWTLESGRRPCLTLPALLRAAASETTLSLDLKGHEARLPTAVIEAMRRLVPSRPYAVCSPSRDLLEPSIDEPKVRVIPSIGSKSMLRDVRARLRDITDPAVSVDIRLLTRQHTAYLRKCAALVVGWTINDSLEAQQALGWGVNGITSDNHDLLHGLLATRGAATAAA